MFNLQGSEIIFILLLALVVLGPEKLPGAIKRAMQTYAELRKLGSGFQQEFKSAIDQPLREMRETADLINDQVDPKKFADDAEQAAEAAAAADRADAELVAARNNATADAAVDEVATDADVDPDAFDDPFDDPIDVPTDDVGELVDPVDDDSPSAVDGSDEPVEVITPTSIRNDIDAVTDEPMEESA